MKMVPVIPGLTVIPTDDPDIAIAIIVENGGTGSEAAVPIAEMFLMRIMIRLN